MTASRLHPRSDPVCFRISAQHVERGFRQMPRHRSHRLAMPFALTQPEIEFAHMPLRTALLIHRHRIPCFGKRPLQIPIRIRPRSPIPYPVTAGVHPRRRPGVAGQPLGGRKAAHIATSSAIVAARITPTPGRVSSHCISGVTSTNSSSRCSNSRICTLKPSRATSICRTTQRVCSGSGLIRASSSFRTLFSYGSVYSLAGKPHFASVAVMRFLQRVHRATNTTRVRVSSRNSRSKPGGIHTVGNFRSAAAGSTRARPAYPSC